MALIGNINSHARHCININIIVNGFHSSAARELNQKWRRDNRLTENPNAFGPLTNLPDYSYADGRPSPFGVRQLGRINKQREILTKIKKLSGEIDYAVERHAKLQQEKAEDRRKIIEGKLKPKGQALLDEPSTKS